MKKKWSYISAALITFLLISFSILFFFIPKAAALALPYRWDKIPVNQSRSIVMQYLGKPAIIDTLQFVEKGDTWKVERDDGIYFLNIQYRIAEDTIAKKYFIGFLYKPGFFKKMYHLKEMRG